MPFANPLSGGRARWSAVVTGALLALFGVPAVAQAACPVTPTSKPFQRFGDYADYSLLSGGTFESGTAGWSLNRSSVLTGNESFHVHAAGDSRSLAIQRDGSAVSPAFCVGREHPTFRFFARRTSGSWGVMLVKLRWTGTDGRTHETTVGALNGNTSWKPGPPMLLGLALPLWQSGQSLNVRLVFDPENHGGDWAIDDVYIDPRMRG